MNLSCKPYVRNLVLLVSFPGSVCISFFLFFHVFIKSHGWCATEVRFSSYGTQCVVMRAVDRFIQRFSYTTDPFCLLCEKGDLTSLRGKDLQKSQFGTEKWINSVTPVTSRDICWMSTSQVGGLTSNRMNSCFLVRAILRIYVKPFLLTVRYFLIFHLFACSIPCCPIPLRYGFVSRYVSALGDWFDGIAVVNVWDNEKDRKCFRSGFSSSPGVCTPVNINEIYWRCNAIFDLV
jgi:hypothetical protein